ncbi:TPA: hypothetical protein CPT80_00280 [Candidatus Gastranaerophilales bacterium HUM_9]|nr:MAG TPA: hypothetical protein CPT80_00280 [Candidatus Gastranaerophilales bacterium HUM_9]HBX35481.1 hypothetical protein [Cyanobacteria bacterium UBA11440]
MARLNKYFSQENISNLFGVIRKNILEQAVLQLSGQEKKNNVDKAVIEFITRTFVSKNILLSFLTKILIDLVPRITQSLYEIIMAKAGEQC